MIFRNMWGVKLREYLDLLLNVLDFVLCTLKVDDLDSNGLLRSFVVSTRRGVKVEVNCWTRRTTRTLYTPLRTIPCLHSRNEDTFNQQHSQHN